MLIKSSLRFVFVFAALIIGVGTAAAQGPVVGASTTSSELEMSATVQTALQLNISTGTGGATVSGSNATGLYAVSFGNINGLGQGAPATGVTVVADGSGALYKTPINLTPVYSGFTTETATIEVQQEAGSSGEVMAREGNGSISASSTVSTSVPAAVASGAASGVAIQRQVGMYAARTTAAGAKSATLIYTITMELN